jgi:hypothetical protein
MSSLVPSNVFGSISYVVEICPVYPSACGTKVTVAFLEPGTIQLPSETDSHWNVSGRVKLGIEKEDGVLENSFFFTCDCELSKGDEGEPIVTGLTRIQVGERI